MLTREAGPRSAGVSRSRRASRRAAHPLDQQHLSRDAIVPRHLRQPDDRRARRRLHRWFRPDVAHVHHLTCLSTGIVSALKQRGIPTVLTLHDYWLLCHRGQLLDLNLQRCDGPLEHGCEACVRHGRPRWTCDSTPALEWSGRSRHICRSPLGNHCAVAQKRWRRNWPSGSDNAVVARLAHMRGVLDSIDRVLAPSRHMRDRFLPLVPGRAHRRQRIRRRRAIGSRKRVVLRSQRNARSALDSRQPDGVEGAAPADRGFSTPAANAATRHARRRTQRVSRRRSVSRTCSSHCFRLRRHRDWTGRNRARFPKRWRRSTLLVVPSIWEENSPLVIREAFAAGVPVVASRIGGIPETVGDGVSGLLFEPGECRRPGPSVEPPDQRTGPALGTPVRVFPRSVTSTTTCRTTRSLYETLVGKLQGGRAVAGARHADRVAAIVLNYQTPDETLLSVRSLLASRRPFDDLIVVDNGGDKALESTLRDVRDRVTILSTGSNLGFSGGVNVGIREARRRGASHVFLVNSDVVVEPTALEVMLRALHDHPAGGIVAPVILARSRPRNHRDGRYGLSRTPPAACVIPTRVPRSNRRRSRLGRTSTASADARC